MGGPTVELLAIGETMAQLAPEPGASLTMGSRLHLSPGGAESNVAIALAQLGHRSAWASRVGPDRLSQELVAAVAAYGVNTSAVETDPDRQSGLYVKVPQPGGPTSVLYYRRGSAASAMDPAFVRRLAERIPSPQAVHLTGITAALSPDCRALTESLLRDRPFGPATVSFDVNFRPALWPHEDPAALLRDLAHRADVVFVGLDEAQRLWGTDRAEDVRERLPDVRHLVVKDGDREAVEFGLEGTTRVPARVVDVVEPVGAGDAFAAGWLSGLLRGEDARRRLLLGHHVAAAVLGSPTDLADLPDPATIAQLLDEEAGVS